MEVCSFLTPSVLFFFSICQRFKLTWKIYSYHIHLLQVVVQHAASTTSPTFYPLLSLSRRINNMNRLLFTLTKDHTQWRFHPISCGHDASLHNAIAYSLRSTLLCNIECPFPMLPHLTMEGNSKRFDTILEVGSIQISLSWRRCSVMCRLDKSEQRR